MSLLMRAQKEESLNVGRHRVAIQPSTWYNHTEKQWHLHRSSGSPGQVMLSLDAHVIVSAGEIVEKYYIYGIQVHFNHFSSQRKTESRKPSGWDWFMPISCHRPQQHNLISIFINRLPRLS